MVFFLLQLNEVITNKYQLGTWRAENQNGFKVQPILKFIAPP